MKKQILVIDDEKNIRMMIAESLNGEDWAVDTAVSGEHGLEKYFEGVYDLVLLDIKMPGIDGMEVLRRVKKKNPTQKIAMITAFGSIETAVEAMKLGAVDYLRKPFTPTEIRALVTEMIVRDKYLGSEIPGTYDENVSAAKEYITRREFDKATEALRIAVAAQISSPEAYNLLGVLAEMKGQIPESLKMYRASLAVDPSYTPATKNLERATQWDYTRSGIDMGTVEADVPEEKK